jgi:hypothetical protein
MSSTILTDPASVPAETAQISTRSWPVNEHGSMVV